MDAISTLRKNNGVVEIDPKNSLRIYLNDPSGQLWSHMHAFLFFIDEDFLDLDELEIISINYSKEGYKS